MSREHVMMHADEAERRQRHQHFLLWILIALSIAAGRIAVVRSVEGDTAFLSANDRSRWCTIASLVEDGTYEIDRLIEIRSTRNRRPWGTIDRVVHRASDGQMHSYSSKPPLYPTMIAGVYAVFRYVTGLTLTEQPIYATRALLAIVNLPMLAIFYWCTIFSIERIGTGVWSRRFAAAAVCFGTMMLPFTVSLNNHLPAAAASAFVLWLYLWAAERLDDDFSGTSLRVRWWHWMVAGVAAAFVAANELPALSMLCIWGVLFWLLERRSILPFAVGAAIVAIAFFATTWIAHQSLRPPYAHRGVGEKIGLSVAATDADTLAETVRQSLLNSHVIDESTRVWIEPSDDASRLRAHTDRNQKFALLPDSLVDGRAVVGNAAGSWSVHHWDDWYEYPGSYWQQGRRAGVDRGEPNQLKYLFHATLGHHGLFSLTPLWLLVPIGLAIGLAYGPLDWRLLMGGIAVSSVVCFVFYILRPEIDRNYGGVSVCFRWMLWFAPLWLFATMPAIEWLSKRWKLRAFISVLLVLSVFSVAASLDSPWQSPWIYRYWSFLGWLDG